MPAAMTCADKRVARRRVADRQHERRAASLGQQLGGHGEAAFAARWRDPGRHASSFEELCHAAPSPRGLREAGARGPCVLESFEPDPARLDAQSLAHFRPRRCAPAARHRPRSAMGFGRTVTATTLGQPLNFVANVALDADETLSRECVVGRGHRSATTAVARDNVRVTLEAARDAGERRVRVTTATVVDEPVVTRRRHRRLQLAVSRRFVAFVDPPVLQPGRARTSEIAAAAARSTSQVAPLARHRPRRRRVAPALAPAARAAATSARRASRVAASVAPRRAGVADRGSGAERAAERAARAASQRDAAARRRASPARRSSPQRAPRRACGSTRRGAVVTAPPRAADGAPSPLARGAAPLRPIRAARSVARRAGSGRAPHGGAGARARNGMQRSKPAWPRCAATRRRRSRRSARCRRACARPRSDRYANGLVYTLAAATAVLRPARGRVLGAAAAPAPARALVRRPGQRSSGAARAAPATAAAVAPRPLSRREPTRPTVSQHPVAVARGRRPSSLPVDGSRRRSAASR